MQVMRTKLDKVLLIRPDIFEDHRGEFIETYNEELFKKNGIDIKFVQDDISVSYRNVLRGIHGDNVTWRVVSCLFGEIYYVVVNCENGSDDFGKWEAFSLTQKNRNQVLIPPRHGGALVSISDISVLQYKQSTYYDPSRQFTYKWDDPRFGIQWPIKKPMLSKRDEAGHYV